MIISQSGQEQALTAISHFLEKVVCYGCELNESDRSRMAGHQEWLLEGIPHEYNSCSINCKPHQLSDLLAELSDPYDGMDLPKILANALEITKALLAEISKAPKARPPKAKKSKELKASVSKAPKASISKAPKTDISKALKTSVSKAQ